MKNNIMQKIHYMFTKELSGLSIVERGFFNEKEHIKKYCMMFKESGHVLAYDSWTAIIGYGNIEKPVQFRTELVPMDGFGSDEYGVMADMLIEISKSKHMWVVDKDGNSVADTDLDFYSTEGLEDFWKKIKILGMKLKLLGVS